MPVTLLNRAGREPFGRPFSSSLKRPTVSLALRTSISLRSTLKVDAVFRSSTFNALQQTTLSRASFD